MLLCLVCFGAVGTERRFGDSGHWLLTVVAVQPVRDAEEGMVSVEHPHQLEIEVLGEPLGDRTFSRNWS